MDNEIIKKWEAMLAALTVAQKSSLICSEEEIEQVEKELGFKFTAGSEMFGIVIDFIRLRPDVL